MLQTDAARRFFKLGSTNYMISKGDIIEIEITDVSDKAQGIGKFEGLVVFVENALLGQKVSARLDKIKSNFALATAIEVLVPSKHQISPICPHADCGGCAYRELSYDAQLNLKQSQVMEKLARLAGLTFDEPFEIIGMENPFYYRNKAQLQIGTSGANTNSSNAPRSFKFDNLQPQIGFYKLQSHDIIDCSECALQKQVVMKIADAVKRFIKFEQISIFNEFTGKGLFRNLIVKIAESTGEIMVILVINGKTVPNVEKLVDLLDTAVNDYCAESENKTAYSLESVILNIHEGKSSLNMGKVNRVIAGNPVISEYLGNLRFEISASAFYQVNPIQMLALYEKVLEFADFKPTDNVLDLYCGVGTIGLFCSKAVPNGCIIGVEAVKSAVIDANRNAVINGITNATFVFGKAEDVLVRILNGSIDDYGFEIPPFSPDVLILDPPRSGCKEELLSALNQTDARKLIYVSCEVATLARDLKMLAASGFTVQKGCIVDMFPPTAKAAVVVLRAKPDYPSPVREHSPYNTPIEPN